MEFVHKIGQNTFTVAGKTIPWNKKSVLGILRLSTDKNKILKYLPGF